MDETTVRTPFHFNFNSILHSCPYLLLGKHAYEDKQDVVVCGQACGNPDWKKEDWRLDDIRYVVRSN